MPEENSTPNPNSATELTVQSSSFAGGLTLILAILAMLGTSFSLWQNFKDQETAQTKLSELNSIARINSTRLSVLQQQNRHLQSALGALSQQSSATRIALNEAADWLRAAQMSQLMNNTNQAVQYLQMADQTLSTTNSAPIQTIRAAINQDLNQLKNAPTTDQTTLIVKLDALNQTILQLPTVFNATGAKEKLAVTSSSENPYETVHWKERLLNSLTYLKSFLVIRHDSDLAVLTPEQQNLIKMIIQFKLMQTQWAVMELHDSIYQHNLSLIVELVQTYFMHSTGSAAVINQIKELQQIHLQGSLPSFNQSLEMIEVELKKLPTISTLSNKNTVLAPSRTEQPKADAISTTAPTHQSVEA